MKTITAMLKRMLKFVLILTGVLALGSGLGLAPCTIGLSVVTQTAKGAVHGVGKIWEVVRR